MRKKNIREEIYEIKSVLRKIIDFKNRVFSSCFSSMKKFEFLKYLVSKKENTLSYSENTYIGPRHCSSTIQYIPS